MHASNILAFLVGLVGLTVTGHGQVRPNAAPAVPDEWVHHPHHTTNTHSQSKRGALGMYECHSKSWYGPCTWTKADGGSCHNWVYDTGGSMGTDKGPTRRIYSNFDCHDNQKHLDWFEAPRIPDYESNQWLVSGGMGDGPASYKCKKS